MDWTALVTFISAANAGTLIAGFLVVLIVSIPLMLSINSKLREQSLQGDLYKQLSDQLKEYRGELLSYQDEIRKQRQEIYKVVYQRNELREEVIELKARIEHLEAYESDVEELRKELKDKDKLIEDRDTRIASLMLELLQSKDRVAELERLVSDAKSRNARD